MCMSYSALWLQESNETFDCVKSVLHFLSIEEYHNFECIWATLHFDGGIEEKFYECVKTVQHFQSIKGHHNFECI